MQSVSLFVLTMLVAGAAGACDLCALYTAHDAQSGTGWRTGLSGQYAHATTLRQEGREVHNEGDEQLDSYVTQLIAGYRFDDIWGVQLNVPMIRREFDRPGEEEGLRDDGVESGLGDIAITASARVLHVGGIKRIGFAGERPRASARQMHLGVAHRELAAFVLAGIKLPTGDSDRLAEEPADEHLHADGAAHDHHEEGGLHDHDLALGSGSVDGIAGMSVVGAADRWFVRAQGLYAIRTEGDHDYTYADDITWSVLPGYTTWLTENGSLGVGLNVNGEHKDKDTRGEEKEDGTALDAIYAGPGIIFTSDESISGELALDLPVDVDNSATQLTPDYRLRAAFTARF